MVKIKCTNCKNTLQSLKEVEEAEERLKEIEIENAEPRLQYQRAPHFCKYCKTSTFFIDDTEIIEGLTNKSNIEVVIRALIKEEGEELITEDVHKALQGLHCQSKEGDCELEIDNIIKRCKTIKNPGVIEIDSEELSDSIEEEKK